MTRPPFGFGPGGRPDEPEGNGDPLGLGGLLGGGGGLFAQLQRLLSWRGGPVNWDLAEEVATGRARDGDRPVTPEEQREAADACRLAELWLDAVTAFPGGAVEGRAWTRTGWLVETLPAWRELVDPVAERVVAAMGAALEQGLREGGPFGGGLPGGLPAEALSGMLGGSGLQDAMRQVGGLVFGAQVGQALGALASEVLSASEVGLPLNPAGRPALLPASLAAYGEGLEVPVDEVRLFVALRECAHQRLFSHVPWLRSHLFDAVDAFGRGVRVDLGAIERALGEVDPTDPASVQRALGQGVLDMEPTEAQRAALTRLETALALVEGWVGAVVQEAASGRLGAAAALREAVQRRRASGGPAEQALASLVGLHLRPRRLREATSLWEGLTAARGHDGRDAVWAHPDLLPTPEDLDDPQGFLARTGEGAAGGDGTDWDAELRRLEEEQGE